MRRLLAVVSVVAVLAVSDGEAQLADGDQQWAARAQGQTQGQARPEPIDGAIRAYQKAIARTPGDLEAHWKLLRAYRFKGAYVARSNDQKKAVYGEAKQAGAAALAVVERLLRERGLSSPSRASEKDVAARARGIAGAGEVYLWDAINWGEWALAYGKLAAVKEGAADRIRRGATIALLVDPAMDGGTPPRVLGRLHDQTPRIPFLTGWASGTEALRLLRESLRIDSANKTSRVFLAEAMVAARAGDRPAAVQILRETISTPANPAYLVEEESAMADARALLRKWGA